MMISSVVISLSVWLLSVPVRAQSSNSTELPVVDLGYQLHRAIGYNDTERYYNFSNIRFAAPPLGDLRFRAPQVPAINRSVVEDGSVNRICPQAAPRWNTIASSFIPAYLTGQGFNASQIAAVNATYVQPETDPQENEDCLFLDVIVPQDIFDQAGKGYGASVMVWIYGGGYTAGTKSPLYDPVGLIKRSEDAPTTGGIVYVALNYRLGAFGWSSGSTVESNGDANVGLLDQRLALEWVQDNIAKFGGDPNRVTVFGESAGGGSILHQITAYGGYQGPAPFSNAILQSPGFQPVVSSNYQEQTFQRFLELANVSSIDELRQLPTEDLIRANAYQIIQDSEYGQFTYGPVVDGDFVPALPSKLLARGNFDTSVQVMDGHNGDEGLFFTSPLAANETGIRDQLESLFPGINDAVLERILNELYPAEFDGSQPYTDNIGRASLLISELVFTCNTYFLDKAYNNETYSYFFSIFPELHGQDVPYTFFQGDADSPTNSSVFAFDTVQNTTVAITMQEWFTSFAQIGRPVGMDDIPYFLMSGSNATEVNINTTSINLQRDNVHNERCEFWQQALWY